MARRGRVFCRLWRNDAEGETHAFIPIPAGVELPTQETINRLTQEHELKSHLDSTWALQRLKLVRERGQTMLVVHYTGGEPLDRFVRQPMEIGQFLQISVALSCAIGRLNGRGLIHKDIKPANVLIDSATGRVRLTGFGIASRLARERQPPEPPEFIAGTLAYMAPEQTGRVNRSIDSRSDLYSLGVTFYEMLTGSLPFTVSDPMEWVHSHIARQPTAPKGRLPNVPAAGLRYHDEAALEDSRGTVSDGRGSGTRSTALPDVLLAAATCRRSRLLGQVGVVNAFVIKIVKSDVGVQMM